MNVFDDESRSEPPDGEVRATDGAETPDELTRRRTARRTSIEERARDGETVEEEWDGQFVWEQGRKVTLSNLISRNVPVEHAFVFDSKRSKGRGGLISLDEDVLIVSRGKVGATRLVPTRDEDEFVSKVVIETHIVAKVIAPADSEDGLALIASVLERRGFSRSAVSAPEGA